MPRYIESIYVEGFRGIRKLKEPIRLTRFNVVIGRNNTGKTSLLEALYIMPTPWEGYLDPMIGSERQHIIARLHGGHPSLIYAYSGLAQLQYKIINATIKISLSEGRLHNVLFNDQEVDNYDKYKKLLAETLNLNEEQVSYFTLFIPNDTVYLRDLYTRILNKWDYLVKHGLHRKIVSELINPVVYDVFTEVLIERGQLKLRKEISEDIGPLYIHIADQGDGIERICLVALALEYAKPGLILWDDIEVAAHPGLIEGVIRWLASKEWQVVITTHSIDVLYTLTYVNPLDAQVILLRKTKDDIVEAKTFSLDEIEELLSKNIDLRKVADVLEL